MSTIKVNQILTESGSTITLGESGKTISIPAGATITNNGTQTGFGRTGSVDWQTSSIKTATFTATSGEGYFVDTSGGAVTVNLPAGSAGAIVAVADYTRTFQNNGCTISPNGSEKLGGVAANGSLITEGQSATFVYVDSTEGWINVQETSGTLTGNANLVASGGTVTTCGNDKIHTFTSPGTFAVSQVSVCASDNLMSYMVVAGGGGSGHPAAGYSGGGGAGGYREVKSPITPYTASPLCGHGTPGNRITVTATSYPITVGAGGAGNSNGSNSIFSTITSAGGGIGALNSLPAPEKPATAGGSGGGGNYCTTAAGAGNTPPTTPNQGNPGGTGINSAPAYGSGGGGGAGGTGQNGSSSKGGDGGNGTTSSINGTPTTRAGGGGGFAVNSGINGGAAGPGGGGSGYGPAGPAGSGGTANTGGGSGGAEGNNTLSGGSGIVIIRYKYQ